MMHLDYVSDSAESQKKYNLSTKYMKNFSTMEQKAENGPTLSSHR